MRQSAAMPEIERPSRLTRYLLVAYIALVAYATLYPLTGWRDPGPGALAFLAAPLPRYVTSFDLAVNFLAYVPLGLLAVAALRPPLSVRAAMVVAALAIFLLSLGLEALQSYLPARIPSNLDLAINTAGALGGAVAAILLERRLGGRRAWRTVRDTLFQEGHTTDAGLVLLALWLVSQLNPETLLFGAGDLRELFAAPTTQAYPPALFVRVEALVAGANLFAVALLARLLVSPGPRALVFVLSLIAAALAVRSIAFGVLLSPRDAFAWATPGALIGLGTGLSLALFALRLPRSLSVALAGLALMAATTVVNIAPENPYLTQSLSEWRQGHFLNLNGLTRIVSAAWPFAAVFYLTLAARGRETSA